MAKDESFFISLGSMTQAIKSEKILKSEGIECTVSKKSGKDGCMWGVWVKGESRERVWDLIRRGGVTV